VLVSVVVLSVLLFGRIGRRYLHAQSPSEVKRLEMNKHYTIPVYEGQLKGKCDGLISEKTVVDRQII
jgi:hypothetical protein